MTKLSFPYVEDYIEIIGGLRDITGKKIPFLSKSPHPTVSLARYDVSIASSFANQSDSGTSFTDRQSELAIKLIEKYKKQLYGLGIDVGPILANIKFRLPVRVVDRSKTIRVEDGHIVLRFPYDKVLVPEVTKAAKESKGMFRFDNERKIWRLSLTEYNVNWAVAFGKKNGFEVDSSVDRLMSMILDCEKTDYKIELTVDEQNNLSISNAEPSLLDYIKQHVGEINYTNLIKLVDYSTILGYTVNTDIAEAIRRGFDPLVSGLIENKESHVKRVENVDDIDKILDPMIKYAELVNRWPICVYEPDLSNKMLMYVRNIFAPEEILETSKYKNSTEVDLTGVKCVYFNKLKRSWPHRIPILISANAMLYGAEKQAILQLAEKVVYYTATVYNKEAKIIGSTSNN